MSVLNDNRIDTEEDVASSALACHFDYAAVYRLGVREKAMLIEKKKKKKKNAY